MDNLIRFDCPHCGKTLKSQPEHCGRRVKCPSRKCGQMIYVPDYLPETDQPQSNRSLALIGGIVAAVVVVAGSFLAWYLIRDKGSSANPSSLSDPNREVVTNTQTTSSDTSKRPQTTGTSSIATKPKVPADSVYMDALAGEWEKPPLSLKIEKGGKGSFEWVFDGGQQIQFAVGDLKVEVKNGQTFITMSPTVFGQKRDFRLLARLSADKTSLDLEETQNQVDRRTLNRKPTTKEVAKLPDTPPAKEVAKVPVTPAAKEPVKQSTRTGTGNTPTLSELTVASAKTSPVEITFSVHVMPGRTPINLGKKSGFWFCFGKPTTIPSMRLYLEKQIQELRPSLQDPKNVVVMGFVNGPGFVAGPCAEMKQSGDVWSAVIDPGLKVKDDSVEIQSAFGPESFPVTEVPISLYVWDDDYKVSNELKAIVNLKEGKLVKVLTEAPKE